MSSDPIYQMLNIQESMNDNLREYIDANEEHILECYKGTEPEMPETDYKKFYNMWLEGLNIDDVSDDFINSMHESSGEEDY